MGKFLWTVVKGNNKFYIEDMKETGIMTMEGNIAKNEFFLLLEQLKQTRA